MNFKEIFQSSDDPAVQQGYTKTGLTQRERELFESADFDYAAGTLLRRQERESEMPGYLRIDNIMRRTRMDRKQALLYRKYLTRIDPRLYRTFEGWMKKRGVDEGLRYFRYLSMQLHSVETPSDDYLEQRKTNSYAPDYWYPVDNERETPWLVKQPLWVMDFVISPKRYNSLKQLRSFGKSMYESEKTEMRTPLQKRYLTLTHDQQSVFWTNYTMRRERLESQVTLGATARALIKQIQKAKSPVLPALGARLYKIQHGGIRIIEPPSDDEWRKVWSMYKRKKSGSK